MNISKEVWFSSIGVGLTTLLFSFISSGFGLWMGASAFIAASYFFGAGAPVNKSLNISISFLFGILLGCFCHWLFLFPHLGDFWQSSLIFGFLTFLVLFVQGTILKFAMVPAWLLAWGTTMLVVSNMAIKNWGSFIFELWICMLLGVFLIIICSNYFSDFMFKLFPEKETITKKEDHSLVK